MRVKRILLLMLGVGLVGCGTSGGSGQAATSPVAPTNALSPITIDNAGVVPAFSDAAVSTQIYVHNNTNSNITDLSYSYTVNLPKSKSLSKSTMVKSAAQNTNIPAGGIAALPISIPALGSKTGKGSALITASYTYQGKKHTFNQVINFQVISNSNPGVYLASGSVSSDFGNAGSAYTTVYAYGGGDSGKVYDVDQLKTDPVLGSVTQGNLVGSKLAAHQVAAIELKTASIAKSAVGTIQLNSSSGGNNYTASKSIAVIAQGAANGDGQAIVLPSMVPFIDTASATTGTAYIYNAGTGDANISNLTGSGGISGVSLDPSCSNNTLTPGQGCTVSFSVPKGAGNGTITATSTPAGGGDAQNISMAVSWYNSNSSLPQLAISSDGDAATLLLHGTNPYTANLNVTVTDLGNAAISNVNAAAPVVSGGSASATIATDTANSCNNATLNQASPSCTYAVNVSDATAPDSGNIILKATGSAGTTNLSASDSVAYQVYQSAAQLAVSFTPASLTVIGDNFESAIGTVTIANVGSDDIASLAEENVNFTPTAGTLQYTATTDCKNKPLAHGASCSETVILIPQSYPSGAPEQGTLNYTVAADGVAETSGATPLNLTVQPYNSAIVVGAIDTAGGSGDGKLSTSAATFQAGSGNSSKVTLTYTNQSATEAMTIGGVVFSDLPTYWQAEYGGENNCLGASAQSPVHTQLAPGASCSVTLDNDLYLLGNANTSTDLSFSLPTLVVNSSGTNQYAFIPGNNLGYSAGKYYATNYQAVITDTNQVLNNGTATATLKITHTATGIESGGYGGSISEKSVITPAMDLNLPVTPDANCSVVKASGAVQETCTLTSGVTTSNSYPVNWGVTGVDPDVGDTLTINYWDLLTGNAWAYNNDAGMATGGGVNSGGDYVIITNQAKKFIFAAYAPAWTGPAADDKIYTYYLSPTGTFASSYHANKPDSTAALDADGATPTGITTMRAKNGTLYIVRDHALFQTCNYNTSGVVDSASCTTPTTISASANTNALNLLVNNNQLYYFAVNGVVARCPINGDGSISVDSCVNAMDGSSGYTAKAQYWYYNRSSAYVYNGKLYWSATYSNANTSDINYCTIQNDGSLTACNTISHTLPAVVPTTVGFNHNAIQSFYISSNGWVTIQFQLDWNYNITTINASLNEAGNQVSLNDSGATYLSSSMSSSSAPQDPNSSFFEIMYSDNYSCGSYGKSEYTGIAQPGRFMLSQEVNPWTHTPLFAPAGGGMASSLSRWGIYYSNNLSDGSDIPNFNNSVSVRSLYTDDPLGSVAKFGTQCSSGITPMEPNGANLANTMAFPL